MTLSPEARAMRVTDAILDLVMVDGENVSASVLHPAQDIIATAIREACNEKLEEAMQCVRDNCLPAECHYALEAMATLKETTP